MQSNLTFFLPLPTSRYIVRGQRPALPVDEPGYPVSGDARVEAYADAGKGWPGGAGWEWAAGAGGGERGSIAPLSMAARSAVAAIAPRVQAAASASRAAARAAAQATQATQAAQAAQAGELHSSSCRLVWGRWGVTVS